jgi:hypothetical protein
MPIMFRIKSFTLAALVALGVAMAATGSAAAHIYIFRPCSETPITHRFLWSTKTLCELQGPPNGGKFAHDPIIVVIVIGKSGIAELKGELLGAEALVTCNKGTSTGELLENGASKGKLVYEECKIGNKKETFANCEVPNISVNVKDQLVGTEAEAEDEMKPASGEIFAEIVINNKGAKTCLEKGTFPVKGSQTCKLPSGESFKVEHEIECTRPVVN